MNEEDLTFEYSPAQLRSIIERVQNDTFSNFLRVRLHRMVRWILRVRNQFRIVNPAVVSQQQNCVLVANPSSHLDVFCLLAALPLEKINTCFAVAAGDYFFSQDIVAYLSRIVANTLPFGRKHGAHAGLKACGMLLDRGNSLIIFPEGTRSQTGQLQQFKAGVGFLMAGRREPVIPAYIDGAYQALPKGRLIPRRHPITVTFGEPLVFEQYANDEKGRTLIVEEIKNAMEMLEAAKQ